MWIEKMRWSIIELGSRKKGDVDERVAGGQWPSFFTNGQPTYFGKKTLPLHKVQNILVHLCHL